MIETTSSPTGSGTLDPAQGVSDDYVLRNALHAEMFFHLEHEGVDGDLVKQLRDALDPNQTDGVGNPRPRLPGYSTLLRLFEYATEGVLRVAVSSMAGKTIWLRAQASTTVAELKGMIDDWIHIPAHEQTLIRGDDILQDGESLAACKVTPKSSTLTVVRVKGRRAISSSADQTLKLWDLDSGVCLRTFRGHNKAVRTVVADWSCMRAVSGSWDHTIKVWNIEDGSCIRTLTGHSNWVNTVVADWSKMCVISGSDDHTLKTWDLQTGECNQTLADHGGGINTIAVDWASDTVISGSDDSRLKVSDFRTGSCSKTLEGHVGTVWCVVADWSEGDIKALSGSDDRTLRLWDISNGTCRVVLDGHTSSVLSIFARWSQMQALSGSENGMVRLWDLKSGDCLLSATMHDAEIWAVCADWTSQRIVTASRDTLLRVWDLEGTPMRALEGHKGGVLSVAMS